MKIGKFRQSPADRKRYVVNYTDWLNEDEILASVLMAGSVPEDTFYVDGYVINEDKEVIFYASGGKSGVTYEVTIKVTTSMQQIKEDIITFAVL